MSRITHINVVRATMQSNQNLLKNLFARINAALASSTGLPLWVALHDAPLSLPDFKTLRELAHSYLPWDIDFAQFSYRFVEEMLKPDGSYYSSNICEQPEGYKYRLRLLLDEKPTVPLEMKAQ